MESPRLPPQRCCRCYAWRRRGRGFFKKVDVDRSIDQRSEQVLEILLHPFLQLFGDLLFPPFADIGHKHSRVERAVSGMDAQIFNFLFPVVQEAHVGCLWDELNGEDAIFQLPKLFLKVTLAFYITNEKCIVEITYVHTIIDTQAENAQRLAVTC